MIPHRLSDESLVIAARRGAVFVLHSDLRYIEADAFLVPTDDFGRIEHRWRWLVGVGSDGRTRQAGELAAELQESGGAWLLPDCGNRSVFALNVGGREYDNSPKAVADRLSRALAVLEQSPPTTTHRARPLVAMPLIGVGRGGLGQDTGEVIQALLATASEHFTQRSPNSAGFDVALVCHRGSDYAAVQHVRKTGRPTSEWLSALEGHAERRDLAVMFGAGASAGLGLPLWSELLSHLSKASADQDLQSMDLSGIDSIDAATILIEAVGKTAFQKNLRATLDRRRHALTHGLIANLHPPLAITTNYDHAYEIAVRGLTGAGPVVLPWDKPTDARPRLLKLHGDLTRGQIVLSRDQFVAMHAFRRPLAGMLQERMLVGHLLAVGTSMSDSTLVHAAEEVRALVKRTGRPGRGHAGTVVLTTEDPARARLLADAFEVVCPGGAGSVQENARDVDVLLDWLAVKASTDLSFVLDPRYHGLLNDEDRPLADCLSGFLTGCRGTLNLRSQTADEGELGRAVREFLTRLGGSF